VGYGLAGKNSVGRVRGCNPNEEYQADRNAIDETSIASWAFYNESFRLVSVELQFAAVATRLAD